MHLSSFLTPDRIKLSLEAHRKKEAIKEVAALLDGAPEIADRERFLKEVFRRESVEATGIGNGVAVPHARTDAVESLVMALGRSVGGVDFGAVDGRPVHLIFIMGTPRSNVTEYLKMMAQLSRMVRASGFVDELMGASSPEAVLEVLKKREES